MLSVKVPKEIKEYKEKILFGLSIRQLIFLVLALLIGFGIFMLCYLVLGISPDNATYFVAIGALPLLAIGFIQKNGMSFEKYIVKMLRHTLGNHKRPYETFYENQKMNGGIKLETVKFHGNKNRQEYKGEAKILKSTRKSAKRRVRETRARIKAAGKAT